MITKSLLAGACLAIAGMGAAQSQTVLLDETFESPATGLPTGWTQQTLATDGGWIRGTALSSTDFTIPAHTRYMATNDDGCNCDKSNDRLISSPLDLSNVLAASLKLSYLFLNGDYQGNDETFKVQASTDNGTTWVTLLDATGNTDWQEIEINLSTYTGQSSVLLGFQYTDGGGWNFGAAIDDISVTTPMDLDASLTAIGLNPVFVGSNTTSIPFTVKNVGNNTLSSVVLSYQIDNGVVVSDTVSGLNLAYISEQTINHGTTADFSSSGNYSLKAWVSYPNAMVDSNSTNDTINRQFIVATGSVSKRALIEVFTSSTCPPCATANPFIQTIVTDNADKVVTIKYQMNYPSPGTDVNYLPSNTPRHSGYGITGIPHTVVGGNVYSGHPGGATTGLTEAMVNDIYSTDAFMAMEINSSVSGNQIQATVTLYPFVDYSNLVTAGQQLELRVGMTEGEITYPGAVPGGTNGETEFHDVLRDLVSVQSVPVSSLMAGDTVTFTINKTIPNLSTYDLADMSMVAFVQNTTTDEVYQAGKSGLLNPMIDLALSSDFNIEDVLEQGVYNIAGTIRNTGSVSVSSFQVKYQIGNAAPVTATSTTPLYVDGKVAFSHPVAWNASTVGLETVKIWVDTLNGNVPDSIVSNSTIDKNVLIASASVPRKTFVEMFTTSSCAECSEINAYLTPLVAANNNLIAANYHVSLLGTSFVVSSLARRNSYNFSSSLPPILLIDGSRVSLPASSSRVMNEIMNSVDKKSFMNLTATGGQNGQQVSVAVDVTPTAPYKDLLTINGEELTINVLLVKDSIGYATAPGSNGETDFFNVNQYFFTNAATSGDLINTPSLDADSVISFSYSHTFPASVDLSNTTAIAFVQNKQTKEVLQAATVQINGPTGLSNNIIAAARNISLYPNPASQQANVSYELAESSMISVSIVNALGQAVKQVANTNKSAGLHTDVLSLQGLSAGMYYVVIKTNKGVSVLPLQVSSK